MNNIIKKVVEFIKNPKSMFKFFVCLSALLHLILSHLQISSISALTDQICGFSMFFFVLLGFVCLFNAIRTKTIKITNLILTTILIAITIGFGAWLLSIYFSAIKNQNNLNVNNIISGITLSFIVIGLYVIGYIEFIIGFIFEKQHKFDVKDDDLLEDE